MQQLRGSNPLELGSAVLPGVVAIDLAPELTRDQLGSVADAENRNPELVDLGIDDRCALDSNALRAAAEDDADGPAGGELGWGRRSRHDLGMHARLANPAGDQLGVLSAEIDDQHRFMGLLGVGRAIGHDQRL